MQRRLVWRKALIQQGFGYRRPTPRHFRETPPAEIDLTLPLPGLSPVTGKTVVNATVVCCGIVAGMFVSEDCPRNEYQATRTQIGRPVPHSVKRLGYYLT